MNPLPAPMWQQIYDPMGNANLSAMLAALPVLFFLLALTTLKLKGLTAALLAVAVLAAFSFFVFGIPFGTSSAPRSWASSTASS